MKLLPVGGAQVEVAPTAVLREVKLMTSAGPLVLRNLDCWVHEQDESVSLTIVCPVMLALGYSTDGLLSTAKQRQSDGEQAGGEAVST